MVFYLPNQSGQKIVFCISIELALTVIFPLLADLIPSTSIMIPLLGKYLLFIMILVALSILNTILILSIYYRQQSQSETMPKWMKYFFVQVLPPFLLLSSQKQDEKKKRQRKHFLKLPRDNTLDAVFSRMLEKLLHLGEIERIFTKFDTAIRNDKNAHDWQHIALVIDRILLIIFTTVSLTGTISILARGSGNTISTVDLNNLDQGVFNACNYMHQD